MTEFAGHAGHAVPDASLQHDTAAHPGAQGDHADIIHGAGRAQPLFSQGRGIGVILKNDGGAQSPLNLLLDRIILPAGQVGRFAQHAALHVNDSRHADANPRKVPSVAKLSDQLADGLRHLEDYLVAPARDLRARSDFFQDITVDVHGSNAEVSASQINANREGGHLRLDSGFR